MDGNDALHSIGLDANPEFVAMMRSAMPELPDEPRPEQVEAGVELGELVQDREPTTRAPSVTGSF
ncbi:hypothetical protein [Kitasatospora sp. NPDC058190]|uniref:hypothetical protein n=1 Tax=Kitasatospora sp. NPDC058190 TaxID=3346371 RepID=UPI0036DF1CED